jgi:hypothetical protein
MGELTTEGQTLFDIFKDQHPYIHIDAEKIKTTLNHWADQVDKCKVSIDYAVDLVKDHILAQDLADYVEI